MELQFRLGPSGAGQDESPGGDPAAGGADGPSAVDQDGHVDDATAHLVANGRRVGPAARQVDPRRTLGADLDVQRRPRSIFGRLK